MKVAVATFGTEGDTRPFVALGRRLAEQGHELLLATDPGALPPEAADLPVLPLDGAIRDRLVTDLGDYVRSGGGVWQGLWKVRQLMEQHLTDWTTDFTDAAADADVLVSSGLALPVAFIAAERLGTPAALVVAQPFEPTAAFAMPGLGRELPARLRVPVGRLLGEVAWRSLRPSADRARAAVGLPARRRPWRDFPEILAASPTLVPRPPDWPERVVVTGDWPLVTPGYTPPPELAAYLAAGEPPVYVGFGSMPVGSHSLAGVLAALDGRRALLAGGWSLPGEIALPDQVLRIGHVPHDWLFPRVATIVHHCGAGTSHAAARAGVPSVPVPFTADQPFWAARLRGAGVATAPLPKRRLHPDDVRRRLEEAAALTGAARDVAERMAGEDGLGVAVGVLEELAARP